mmetsp:Transcript_8260/g.22758  ORF Transcript_8260/g.22758 Transcript_8260/m.22758 type:complete len:290 (-) Transcript_8260:943-1812(-)
MIVPLLQPRASRARAVAAPRVAFERLAFRSGRSIPALATGAAAVANDCASFRLVPNAARRAQAPTPLLRVLGFIERSLGVGSDGGCLGRIWIRTARRGVPPVRAPLRVAARHLRRVCALPGLAQRVPRTRPQAQRHGQHGAEAAHPEGERDHMPWQRGLPLEESAVERERDGSHTVEGGAHRPLGLRLVVLGHHESDGRHEGGRRGEGEGEERHGGEEEGLVHLRQVEADHGEGHEHDARSEVAPEGDAPLDGGRGGEGAQDEGEHAKTHVAEPLLRPFVDDEKPAWQD